MSIALFLRLVVTTQPKSGVQVPAYEDAGYTNLHGSMPVLSIAIGACVAQILHHFNAD